MKTLHGWHRETTILPTRDAAWESETPTPGDVRQRRLDGMMLALIPSQVVGVWRGPGLARPQFDRPPLTVNSPLRAMNMLFTCEQAGG